MKLGINIKIDVTKIDKSRLFKGKQGIYLDLTTFIDTDNPGKFGDHGFISQETSKEEREQGVQTPILGNVKVFHGLGQGQPSQNQQSGYQNQQSSYQGKPNQGYQGSQQNTQGQGKQQSALPDDDIPF